ncbi:MAG TPA: YggT family protein [Thermoleophilia bacterium]|nr:YggT family protein [Thermoleophilia bacterium]
MTLILAVVSTALTIYSFAILVRILLSWIPLRSGTTSYRLYGILYDVTEPYLRLFRRYLPLVRFGNAALDLSPIAGLVVLFIVQQIISRL